MSALFKSTELAIVYLENCSSFEAETVMKQ
jgi:hypothetical protein